MSEIANDSFVAAVERGMDAANVRPVQRLRIRMRLALPGWRRELESAAGAELLLAGVVEPSATGLIDWDNLDIDKLIALIEAIMKIIQMFM